MKKLVSSWILFSSVLALGLSFVAFSHAADTSATAPSETKDRPALRGDRALGPFTLFDTNRDGVLSTDELNNASVALYKLDKNGDGKLTADELRPKGPPPPREGGPDSDERRGGPQHPPEDDL